MKLPHTLYYVVALSAVLSLLLLPLSQVSAATGTEPYVGFHKQTTQADFAGSTTTGVTIGSTWDGRADVRLASSGLLPSNKEGEKFYKVKSYHYGTLVSPVFDAAHPFDTAISSWNAITPAGTWLQVELRAYRPSDAHWTKYYIMGVWASGTDTIERHSVNGQGDSDGTVLTDTLVLYGQPVYTKYQYRLTLFTTDTHASPSVSLMSVMTSNSYKEPDGLNITSDQTAWGINLNVPQRSQMIYKKGGEVWCSPTSTSMVLAYWGYSVPVPEAASDTWDYVYDGAGNWPFNTAWAGTFGMEAYVTRMGSMTQIEEWIKAGVPVVISLAWNNNDPAETLPGAAITSSGGHLMVVRGFTSNGDVITNDPAFGSDDTVQHVYPRGALEHLWLEHSGGTVYLIYPRGHAVPTEGSYGSW